MEQKHKSDQQYYTHLSLQCVVSQFLTFQQTITTTEYVTRKVKNMQRVDLCQNNSLPPPSAPG